MKKFTLGEIALNVIGISFRMRPSPSNLIVSLQPPFILGHHSNSSIKSFSGGISLLYQFKVSCLSSGVSFVKRT